VAFRVVSTSSHNAVERTSSSSAAAFVVEPLIPASAYIRAATLSFTTSGTATQSCSAGMPNYKQRRATGEPGGAVQKCHQNICLRGGALNRLHCGCNLRDACVIRDRSRWSELLSHTASDLGPQGGQMRLEDVSESTLNHVVELIANRHQGG
jgi:hypothetical protein